MKINEIKLNEYTEGKGYSVSANFSRLGKPNLTLNIQTRDITDSLPDTIDENALFDALQELRKNEKSKDAAFEFKFETLTKLTDRHSQILEKELTELTESFVVMIQSLVLERQQYISAEYSKLLNELQKSIK